MSSASQRYLPLLGEPPLPIDAWEQQHARWLRRLALAIVVIGLVWRFTRYLLCFPVWCDEAMLLVNYFSRSYLDVLGPINNCQVAPILFHWIELTAMRWLGTSEWALRMPAFLACLGSLALFWQLTRRTLPPLARTIAIAIISVSIWPATMGSNTKPYASDLLFSLILIMPAVAWLRDPSRRKPLVFLTIIVPFALVGSYPAVFVAGAVSLALVPVVWRRYERKTVVLFALYNLLLVGTFAAHYLLVGRTHLASPLGDATTGEEMERYWQEGFPPLAPIAFLKWFVLAHTGQFAAYPIGSVNGGSTVTVLLALIGVRHLYRNGQRGLVVMFAGTLGLGFVAALLHKYPHGANCRLAQHLAPFWCLTAGVGVAVLIGRLAASRARWKATLTICGVLAAIGIGGIVRDVVHPYRDEDALWASEMLGDFMTCAGDDPVVSVQAPENLPALVYWQLGRRGEQVTWGPAIDWPLTVRQRSSLWVFSYGLPTEDEQDRLELSLLQTGQHWRCVESKPLTRHQHRKDQGVKHCRVYHWLRDQEQVNSSERIDR